MYQSIETGLNKAAIFIVIKDNGTLTSHLVTRNKSIISFFDNGFTEIPYSKNIENNTIEAYELRYNRVVNIDTTHIHEVYYYGLPAELAPPVFLNPEFKNVINESMIVKSQLDEFLVKVKRERDSGMYQEHPYVEADVDCLYRIKHFFEQEYNTTSKDTDVLELFDKYEIFNIMSHTVAVKTILGLYEKIFFLPMFFACSEILKENLKDILPGLISGEAFIKSKWIAVLEATRVKEIQKFTDQKHELEANLRATSKDDGILDQEELTNLYEQYNNVIQSLTDISFEDRLALFNDYRLYLRYWPVEFTECAEFHSFIRPFTELEYEVIKCFIKANIPFDFDSIYRKEFDYYNSVITALEVYADDWRSYKLKCVEETIHIRLNEINTEFLPMLDNLTQDEQQQFHQAIADIMDIEGYRTQLNALSRLTDIMSFWPVALQPAPDDTLTVW